MLGRGIDQIMRCPSDPTLYESYVTSALGYVELAERANGPIPRKCSFDYVWGQALGDLDAARPAARIINLETSITTSMSPAPKGINYKMHPGNVSCLKAAKVDCCVLANNHVLDWGREGLLETLSTYCGGKVLPLPGQGLISRKPRNRSRSHWQRCTASRVRHWVDVKRHSA